ncbi:phage structural protein [Phascolarctobacterium sp.]|uniref:phage structural protein n=1 Tax=Phascolarctobacterium sp. TaxID=2049039 RepID=UPI0038630520
MANITTYNAKDCVITVGGVYITGLGEDMVSGEKDEDNVSAVVGAQGDVVVNEINNDLGTITLTVQGTSPQLPYLKKLARAKTMTDVWVNNKSIGEKFGGSKAIVKKTPSLEYGAELADREIEIQVFDYTVE